MEYDIVLDTTVDVLPEKPRSAMLCAIDLVTRYKLPRDVEISEIPSTARHAWRKDGSCVIMLSPKVVENGDHRAVHRRIIHEAAHHMAGRGHGHDERFCRIAADLYEREGYPRGRAGDHRGNM